MADLEAHAIRRDRRFLVRLGIGLLLGLLAGAWVFGKLTSHETGTCAASRFGGADAETPTAR